MAARLVFGRHALRFRSVSVWVWELSLGRLLSERTTWCLVWSHLRSAQAQGAAFISSAVERMTVCVWFRAAGSSML